MWCCSIGMSFKSLLPANVNSQRPKLRYGRRNRDVIIILDRYSWLLIIFTVVSHLWMVTSTETTTSDTKTSSSTVRPWPSHEFFQNVMKEGNQGGGGESIKEKNVIEIVNDKFNQSVLLQPFSTTPSNLSQSQRETKQLNTTFAISLPKNSTIENDVGRTIDKSQISIHLQSDAIQNEGKPLGNVSVSEIKSREINQKNISLSHYNQNIDLMQNTKNATQLSPESPVEREALHKSLSFDENHNDNENSKSDKRNQQSFVPRHWISIASSSSSSSDGRESEKVVKPKSDIPPIIQTNGELPFRVSPVKKTRLRTELSPEFYAKLSQVEKGHPDHDYVNDEKISWWQDEDQDKTSLSTIRPPNFTRLTWPYTTETGTLRPQKSGSTLKQQQILLPIVTGPSSLNNYPKITTKKPTSSSYSSLFPIIHNNNPSSIATTPSTIIRNKIHHWGSSGSQKVTTHSNQNLFQPVGSLRVNVTGSAGLNPLIVVKPQTTGIKLSTDVITSTSTESSVMTQLRQVFLTSVPGTRDSHFQGDSVTGSTKSPTNIWYKPVINHHYSNGDGIIPTLSSTTSGHPPSEDKKEKEQENQEISGPDQVKVKQDEEFQGEHILFKLWSFSNGTLELNNQRRIPSWLLKDFEINDDQILNLDELPQNVQKIVEDKFSTVKSKEGQYHLHGHRQHEINKHWQQLPTIHPSEEGKYHGMFPGTGSFEQKRPISLNYVFWDHDHDPPPTKTPHDFLLHQFPPSGHGQSNPHLQKYLQYFLTKPDPFPFQDDGTITPESIKNWSKLDNYLKQQASGSFPYSSLLDLQQQQFPTLSNNWNDKFEDKDISNLVAVSLILSYLNKNKQDNYPGSSFLTPRPEMPEHLHSLLTSIPPSPSPSLPTLDKDSVWDSIRPALKGMKGSKPHEDYFLPTSPSLPPPSYLFDTMISGNSPGPGFSSGHHMTSGSEPGSFSSGHNLDRFRLEESDLFLDASTKRPRPTTTTRRPPLNNPATLERGETLSHGVDHNLKTNILTKKKLRKKHLKKKKLKKKGSNNEQFGLNFDVGVDLADLFRQKFLALLTLQYAPFLLAILIPTLIVCSPYIMQALRGSDSKGNKGYYQDRDDVHSYNYPYNYAYPVQPGGGSNFDDSFDYPYEDQQESTNKGTSYLSNNGRGGQPRNRKRGNVAIHHHFHDIPITNPQSFTFSPTYPLVPTGIVAEIETQPQLESVMGDSPSFSNFDQRQRPKDQKYYDEPLASGTNDADAYMKKIRDIGRNIGLMIGSKISDQSGMASIIDSKTDAITKLLENWSLFSSKDKRQYRDSEEDDLFKRTLPLRKRIN